ncbi:hypothetical protein Misp01_64070 [Microtetraspora sp. NBRC 13810]|uniref:hypothetical protein n=1 Tax=Microtetraspora sp. NBRC 13810 TaxID=3030990 RepID=UPI0024A28416|nr:hypothetical protein [Microtetraspora sp. NBRC 13810]GLW11279.1 hypothetical protein Misp01_64070 [Microtetraspora sp. NBRC 13810]
MTRAWAFALVCVGLSQTGHDLMAPRPVPAWSAGVALGLVAAIGYRLADRERSPLWILAAMEAGQLYLHVWFAWTTPATGVSAPVTAHLMATSHHGAPVGAHDGMSSLVMFAAHALAGAFVALWLSMGERALWRALRSLAFALSARLGWIFALAGPAPIPRRPAVAHRARDDAAPAMAMHRHALVRRGPPRGVHPIPHPA